MADTTFRERLPDLRNQYGRLKSKAAKGRFLDKMQGAYGCERKFLIKRLTGNRPFRRPIDDIDDADDIDDPRTAGRRRRVRLK